MFKEVVYMINTLEELRDSNILDSAKIDCLYRISNWLLQGGTMEDTYIKNIFRYANMLLTK